MVIAGLDLSISSSGVVKFYLDDKTLQIIDVKYLGFTSVKKNESSNIIHYKTNDFKTQYDKFNFMNNKIQDFIEDCEYLAIENYAFGATGQIFSLAEFEGNVKINAYNNLKKLRIYDITSIKKYATGSGISDKISMYNSFVTEQCIKPILNSFGPVNKSSGIATYSDIIDAFWIARFLQTELMLRHGIILLKDLSKDRIELFNRVTKSAPENLLSTNFIQKQ